MKGSGLLVLMIVFLVIALFALAFRAKQRWGYGPFGLGILASSLMILGKFVFISNIILYAGVGFLIMASLWNIWPVKRRLEKLSCPRCELKPYS